MQTVCLAFCMPLTIGLVMLLVWNVYLALQNKTTIEFHEGVTANIKVCDLAWDHLRCQCRALRIRALCTAAYSLHLVPLGASPECKLPAVFLMTDRHLGAGTLVRGRV